MNDIVIGYLFEGAGRRAVQAGRAQGSQASGIAERCRQGECAVPGKSVEQALGADRFKGYLAVEQKALVYMHTKGVVKKLGGAAGATQADQRTDAGNGAESGESPRRDVGSCAEGGPEPEDLPARHVGHGEHNRPRPVWHRPGGVEGPGREAMGGLSRKRGTKRRTWRRSCAASASRATREISPSSTIRSRRAGRSAAGRKA